MLARRRAFPGLPYAGAWLSQARQGSFIKVAGARGTWAEAAVPCLTPFSHAGHGGRHSPLAKTCWKDGLCFCTRLAHTPAQRANPEVFYPLYICLRKFKSKFGPWLCILAPINSNTLERACLCSLICDI